MKTHMYKQHGISPGQVLEPSGKSVLARIAEEAFDRSDEEAQEVDQNRDINCCKCDLVFSAGWKYRQHYRYTHEIDE